MVLLHETINSLGDSFYIHPIISRVNSDILRDFYLHINVQHIHLYTPTRLLYSTQYTYEKKKNKLKYKKISY